eukprot:6763979-Alexandrium_andersonii.AAC.1
MNLSPDASAHMVKSHIPSPTHSAHMVNCTHNAVRVRCWGNLLPPPGLHTRDGGSGCSLEPIEHCLTEASEAPVWG